MGKKPFPDAKVLISTFEKLKVNAAVFGQDGKEWASSPNFQVTREEAKAITAVFGDNKDASEVTIAGHKFSIENRDNVSFSGNGATEIDKFAVRKSHDGIVVATWGQDGPTLARGAEKVDNAADYMMNEGY